MKMKLWKKFYIKKESNKKYIYIYIYNFDSYWFILNYIKKENGIQIIINYCYFIVLMIVD